jgi:hypothetical protein
MWPIYDQIDLTTCQSERKSVVSRRPSVYVRVWSEWPVSVAEWSKASPASTLFDARIYVECYWRHWCSYLCVRLFYVCVVLCRYRSCDELITRPRSPTDCLRLRNWSGTESFMDAPFSSGRQKRGKKIDLSVTWIVVIEILKSVHASGGVAAVICRSLIKFMRYSCCLWYQCKICLQSDRFKAMERKNFSYAHSCISWIRSRLDSGGN